MALLVQKFGGTSVGTPDRIRAVADRIARVKREGHKLVVVISAMGHTTDELIALAHQVSESPSHREMDMLLTAGERISMALLSMALADRGVDAISLTGSQSGIITDGNHRRARIKRILGDRVREGLSRDQVVIVAGFQGVSEAKEITTLGRGGSDTTAVALASALQADRCEIYTDVDGIYSADPRKIPDAKFWPELPAHLMVELALRGAGVLHPRSVELACQSKVKLVVRNSMNNGRGTELVSDPETEAEMKMEKYAVVGVTTDAKKNLMTVELMRPSVFGAVCELAAEQHLGMLATQFSDSKLRFFIDEDSHTDWKKLLDRLTVDGFVKSYRHEDHQVPLSVIGQRLGQDGAALHNLIETLAHSSISVTMGSVSAFAITVAVNANRADEAVKALHQKYFAKG